MNRADLPDYVNADWKGIYDEAKTQGHSLRSLTTEIGCNYRNSLYGGYNMRAEVYEKLADLLDIDLEKDPFRLDGFEKRETEIITEPYIDRGRVNADWQSLFETAKEKGYTLRSLSEEIGSNYRNQLYSGYGMNRDSYDILIEALGLENVMQRPEMDPNRADKIRDEIFELDKLIPPRRIQYDQPSTKN